MSSFTVDNVPYLGFQLLKIFVLTYKTRSGINRSMPGGLIGRGASTAWPLRSLDNHHWISPTPLACMKNLVYQGTSNDLQVLTVGTKDAANYGNSQHASKHVDKYNLLLTNLLMRTDAEYHLGICHTTRHAPLKFTKLSDKKKKLLAFCLH